MPATVNALNYPKIESKPVINLLPDSLYKYLHKKSPKPLPERRILDIRAQLEAYNLQNIIDDTELISLPLPRLGIPLDQWIEDKIRQHYNEYLEEADYIEFVVGQGNYFQNFERPPISPYTGWSRYVKGEWEPCDKLPTNACVFDFETAKKYKDSQPKPFMASAVCAEGIVYSWLNLAESWDDLDYTVEFGDQIRLLIGHNCVSYDRRFVKEFYKFAHPVRMFDTFSFYHITLGMSQKQGELYRIFETKDRKLPWMHHTCRGGLASLAEFLCGIELDKSIREEFLSGKGGGKSSIVQYDEESDLPNGNNSIEELQSYEQYGVSLNEIESNTESESNEVFDDYSRIRRNISDIWDYCLNDTLATACVFQKLYKKVSAIKSKIYLAGQLERSTVRLAVDPEIDKKISVVENCNREKLKDVNTLLKYMVRDKFNKNESKLMIRVEGALTKDYYERIFKSTAFPYKNNLDRFKDIVLPDCLIAIGWEEDESGSKRSSTKNNTLLKLKAVHYALENGFKTKIQKGDRQKWMGKLLKKPNLKIDEPYISLSGKDTPVILGMTWNGRPLVTRGNTWGVIVDGQFERLKHPKGADKNVGTPLGKEFFTKVLAKEFGSDIDLKVFFETVSETTLWEKFQKRFKSIFTVDNIWLPEIIPSGTVTGRSTGALAVVMTNTSPKRSGSEMKLWFGVEKGHVKISADYSGQESEIFTAHIDAQEGHSGLNVYSCIVHAGKQSNKTDIHNVVAKMLSATAPVTIERKLAKNMNFANQFFCGSEKLALMVYIGLNGSLPMDQCLEVANAFQEQTRGKIDYGRYFDGMASIGFNRLKEMAKEPGQYCRLTYRPISAPLDAKNACWVNEEGKKINSELTTRANYSIQGTGQGLIDICMIVCRILGNEFNVPFNPGIVIHDEFHADTLEETGQDFAWIFQVAHFFSKALMYERFGVNNMPINKMWFESVEVDTFLRKTPKDAGVTPSNSIPYPHLWFPNDSDYPQDKYGGQSYNSSTLAILSPKDCVPSSRIQDLLYTVE